MSEWAVELREVTKVFAGSRGSGEVLAVDRVSLPIKQGEFFTLLGPSGCGKTTILRMIAGFETPTAGEVVIEGVHMQDRPPNRRPVNTVFQNYALFPHLSVGDNVGFGLQVKRVPREERARRVREALALVQLPGLEDRRPTQLSGGQQQRVALARALINEPKVLLLDEPLGALDLKLRKAVQVELKLLQAELGITFIYVTHDQEEALTMSDRIAVLKDGQIQQVGVPREIYDQPVNRFVADFIGETNFLSGEIRTTGDIVTVDVAGILIPAESGERGFRSGQPVTLAVRPEKINLYRPDTADVLELETGMQAADLMRLFGGHVPAPKMDVRQYLEAEPNNVVLEGIVQDAIYIGTDLRYRVALNGKVSIYVRVQNFGQRYDETFDPGQKVLVHWPAENGRILES